MLLPGVSKYYTYLLRSCFEGDPDMEQTQDSVILGEYEKHSIIVFHLRKAIPPRVLSLAVPVYAGTDDIFLFYLRSVNLPTKSQTFDYVPRPKSITRLTSLPIRT